MKRRTHTKDGQELSDLFIADDGLLSIYANDTECEVTGCGENVFGFGMFCEPK